MRATRMLKPNPWMPGYCVWRSSRSVYARKSVYVTASEAAKRPVPPRSSAMYVSSRASMRLRVACAAFKNRASFRSCVLLATVQVAIAVSSNEAIRTIGEIRDRQFIGLGYSVRSSIRTKVPDSRCQNTIEAKRRR